MFSTEIKLEGWVGFFFFFVGAEIKSFILGMLSLRQQLGYQGGARYSFGCTYLEFGTISWLEVQLCEVSVSNNI